MKKIHCFIFLMTLVAFTACPKAGDEGGAFTEGLLTGTFVAPDDTSAPAGDNSITYGGTTSPGDVVEWTIYDLPGATGTQTKGFVMANLTEGQEIVLAGDAQVLPTGFIKMTINDSTDTTQVPVGAQAYAFEVPGLMLFVHPISGDDGAGGTENKSDMMMLVATGDCNFEGDMNLMQMAYSTEDQTTAWATLTITRSANSSYDFDLSGTVTAMANGISPSVAAPTVGSLVCYGGRIFDRDTGSLMSGFASSAGGMVLDFGPGRGGIVGFKAGAISAEAANKSYTGIISTQDPSGLNQYAKNTIPASLICSEWNCTGAVINDIETGAVTPGETATFDLTGGFTNGVGNGSVVVNTPTTLKTIAYELDGRTVIAFSGVSDNTWTVDGTNNQMINGILVSK